MTMSGSGGSSSSSLHTNSHVSTLAWNQRAQRRRKRSTTGGGMSMSSLLFGFGFGLGSNGSSSRTTVGSGGGTANKQQKRLLFGFVACLIGLVLIVVHVELSLLHKATTSHNNNNVPSAVMEPGRRIMSSSTKTHPTLQHEKKFPTTHHQLTKKDNEKDNNKKEEFTKKAHMNIARKSGRQDASNSNDVEKKNAAVNEVHQINQNRGQKEPATVKEENEEQQDKTTTKHRTIKLTKEEHDNINNNNNNNNAEQEQQQQQKLAQAAAGHNNNNNNNQVVQNMNMNMKMLRIEDHSDLKDLIVRTEQGLSNNNNKKKSQTADFCSSSTMDDTAPIQQDNVIPAIIVLGMEDTSTNLLWHVLSHIMPAGTVTAPSPSSNSQNNQATPLQYEALKEMDPEKEEQFWESLPLTDHATTSGGWVQQVLCRQQQQQQQQQQADDNTNNNNILGFPWLTLGDMSQNGRAIATLRAIANGAHKYRKESSAAPIKIIRYRRNVLDMISRQEQHLTELRDKQPLHAISLDTKHGGLLRTLTHWNARQKAVDKFLQDANIPHIVVDHETLFPFNDWRDLVNVTTIVEKYQVPLNVKIDFSRIAPDERPPEPSQMELEWTKVLNYLNIDQTHPTTLFDIFYSAFNYPFKGRVFWRQQQVLTNYAAVQQALAGTHFQDLLRNMEYHHDFYGCACNDKEANRKHMWNAFKKHHAANAVNANADK